MKFSQSTDWLFLYRKCTCIWRICENTEFSESFKKRENCSKSSLFLCSPGDKKEHSFSFTFFINDWYLFNYTNGASVRFFVLIGVKTIDDNTQKPLVTPLKLRFLQINRVMFYWHPARHRWRVRPRIKSRWTAPISTVRANWRILLQASSKEKSYIFIGTVFATVIAGDWKL